MARTHKNTDGMTLLGKAMRGVSKAKNAYKSAWDKWEKSPRYQKAKNRVRYEGRI